jgi:molecular chaperone DnaK (HSP70)
MVVKRQYLLFLALAFMGCNRPAEITALKLSAHSTEGSTLSESLGIETLGGVFTPLLKKGCQLPCEITQVISTGDDHQEQIKISLYQKDTKMASDAKKIGIFEVSGFRPGLRGTPSISVTFIANSDNVVLRATDNNQKSTLAWSRID